MTAVFKESRKHPTKNQNEDTLYDFATAKGRLFVVLDFAPHNYLNLTYDLESAVEPVILALAGMPELTADLFLACVAREINNHVYRLGRLHCSGRLACVAAFGLLKDDRFHYLTYGDARINVYNGAGLLLLNGAKYESPGFVDSVQENPQPIVEQPDQMGRRYFDLPLTDRACPALTLYDQDVLLIFSDGLEEGFTPQQRLFELNRIASSDPNQGQIGAALLEATNSSQDDRTLIVICGPYDRHEDPALKDLGSRIDLLSIHLDQHQQSERQAREESNALMAAEIENLASGTLQAKSSFERSLKDTSAQFVNKTDQGIALESVRTELLTELSRIREGNPNPQQTKKQALTPSDLQAQLESVIGQYPNWWRDQLNKGEPESVHAKPVEDRGTIAASRTLTFSFHWQAPLNYLSIVHRIAGEGGGGLLYATEFKRKDLRQKAIEGIDSEQLEFTRFDEAMSYIHHHRRLGRRIKDWLGLKREEKLVSIFRSGFFIIVGVTLLFFYQSQIQHSSPPNEDWGATATGNQLALTRRDSGGREVTLQLELAKPVYLDRAHEPFHSFNDVTAYLQHNAFATPTKNGSASPGTGPGRVGEGTEIVVNETEDAIAQPNDNIAIIARRYSTTQEKLRDLNPGQNWGKLMAGQKIKVPRVGGGPQ